MCVSFPPRSIIKLHRPGLVSPCSSCLLSKRQQKLTRDLGFGTATPSAVESACCEARVLQVQYPRRAEPGRQAEPRRGPRGHGAAARRHQQLFQSRC